MQTAKPQERVTLELPVRLRDDAQEYVVQTSNISVGGCYIVSPRPARVGSRIMFELQLPGGHWLLLNGEVVHGQPAAGYGVRFGRLPESAYKALEQLVEISRQQ